MTASQRRARHSCRFRTIVLSIFVATLSGCAISPLASRTAEFSSAATATIAQTTNAYQLVNQTYADAQMAMLVARYDTAGFDADKIKPYLPAKDLEVRTKVLNGLQQYAALLAEVSGNQPISDFETQAKAAGGSLVQLQQDDFNGFKISSTDQNIAVTAMVAIGGVLIEHERERALPGILDKMNKPIQDICKVLEADIGTTDTPGLADALHRSYDKQIEAQKEYIHNNAASMSADQKRTEIEALPRLVIAQRQSDQTLAKTSKSIAALAAAHAALTATKTEKDSPAFKLKITELVQNAQAISGFYTSLSTTK
ncbi:MAG: hypothetical protein ABSF70_07295 [Terracidiphilus sp.]